MVAEAMSSAYTHSDLVRGIGSGTPRSRSSWFVVNALYAKFNRGRWSREEAFRAHSQTVQGKESRVYGTESSKQHTRAWYERQGQYLRM